MHIAISGNIGAGKTTLARLLSEHYGWEIQYEAVEGNPYLPPFYGDMEKWAFHLQIYFLNSRFEQALKIQNQTEKTIVQDRSIYEDAFIFAQNLHDNQLLNDTDFATYKGLFNTITQTIYPPDLMIYLKADLPKLQKQIKIRNRDYEQSIDPNYLLQLNALYESFTSKYTYGRIIEIDVNNMNFLENKSDFDYIITMLESTINLGAQLKI
jgi:deoxyadenosine/deoxycytidine kinase